MFQFSLQRMFLGVTVIAVGFGMIGLLFYFEDPLMRSAWVFGVSLWFAAGATIGAGLFLPFKRQEIGVALGLGVQLLILAALGF